MTLADEPPERHEALAAIRSWLADTRARTAQTDVAKAASATDLDPGQRRAGMIYAEGLRDGVLLSMDQLEALLAAIEGGETP